MALANSAFQAYIEAHLKNLKENWHQEKRTTRAFVTISREAGAYGTTVAEKLTEYLTKLERRKSCPWTLFEKELLATVSQEHDLPLEMLSYFPESTVTAIEAILEELFKIHPSQYNMAQKVGQTSIHLAQLGNCVLLGRGANIVTAKFPFGVHVRLIASLAKRTAHIQEHFGFDEARAKEFIRHHDSDRRNFIRRHFNKDINDAHLYDLVINMDQISVDETVSMIGDLVFKKNQTPRGNSD